MEEGKAAHETTKLILLCHYFYEVPELIEPLIRAVFIYSSFYYYFSECSFTPVNAAFRAKLTSLSVSSALDGP